MDRDYFTEAEANGALVSYGLASTGRYLAVVWDRVIGEPWTIYPITARLIRQPDGDET